MNTEIANTDLNVVIANTEIANTEIANIKFEYIELANPPEEEWPQAGAAAGTWLARKETEK